MNTKAPQALATALVKQPTRNMKQVNPLAQKITCAEEKMVTALIHHNLNVPLAMADTLSPLMADLYSQIQTSQSGMPQHAPKCILNAALNIKLLEPLAQGASRFEKLLAPPKSTGPQFFQTT